MTLSCTPPNQPPPRPPRVWIRCRQRGIENEKTRLLPSPFLTEAKAGSKPTPPVRRATVTRRVLRRHGATFSPLLRWMYRARCTHAAYRG